MITCKQCGQEQLEGSVICSNCGAVLVGQISEAGTKVLTDTQRRQLIREVERGTKTLTEGAQIVLDFPQSGKRQSHKIETELVLGRIDEFSTFKPDVNLDPFGGWAGGVSRLHAKIVRQGDNIYIIDLASRNGTFLNGDRLPPREPHLLHFGDSITVGMLEIILRFEESPQEVP